MEFESPGAVEELEAELRAAREQLARIEIEETMRPTAQTEPPRVSGGAIPPHVRAMSKEALEEFIVRVEDDLHAARFGWHFEEDEEAAEEFYSARNEAVGIDSEAVDDD